MGRLSHCLSLVMSQHYMVLEIKKREGETLASFLYRFNKRVRNSGLVKEVRKRQFKRAGLNKLARRKSALYRARKETEIIRTRKYGRA